MRKKVILATLIIIFCITLFTVSNATSIVTVSSQTVTANTEFYLVLNLSSIPYNRFKVEITNTSSLKTDDIEAKTISAFSESSGVTSFIVDKASIGLDKIGIVYTSTKNEEIINFTVKITNLNNTVETMQTQVNTLIQEINTLNVDLVSLKTTLSGIIDSQSEEYVETNSQIEVLEATIEEKNDKVDSLEESILNFKEETQIENASVEVIDKQTQLPDMDQEMNKEESPWGDMDSIMKDKMNEMDKENEKMSMNMKEMMNKMTNLESDLDTAKNTISSLTQTNVYQGSQNNYLKSLSVSNVEFKNEFKKTTSDYFASVDENTSSVVVNAVAEDSDAIVTVYGNTNLQTGKNKIIISITAADGSVRNYRIYITK